MTDDLEWTLARYLAQPPGEPVCPPATFRVPEDAQIRLDDRYDGSHLLAGAAIAYWPEDAA
ncbi:hypothetical protein [Mycobacterium scrofulaceum]|uniref:Uncharacterized protein n=1 Tax=Mycobacterium scrofulaceum TaxID=1783 RepID=A0A1X0KD56_MYCSC|nr:hypothetical protein [Mycobacterium scrofulaceum]ORB73131.1 hypothetical protein BST44_16325 [Mycobacterium scrofulaceum]